MAWPHAMHRDLMMGAYVYDQEGPRILGPRVRRQAARSVRWSKYNIVSSSKWAQKSLHFFRGYMTVRNPSCDCFQLGVFHRARDSDSSLLRSERVDLLHASQQCSLRASKLLPHNCCWCGQVLCHVLIFLLDAILLARCVIKPMQVRTSQSYAQLCWVSMILLNKLLGYVYCVFFF